MTDVEKVLSGIEQCLMDSSDERYDTQCHDCPYFNPDTTVKECKRSLIDDAYKIFDKYTNVVRCKDCKHRPELKLYSDMHGNYTAVEFPDGSKCPCQCEDFFYSWYPKDDWFCANGERKDNE